MLSLQIKSGRNDYVDIIYEGKLIVRIFTQKDAGARLVFEIPEDVSERVVALRKGMKEKAQAK